MCVCIYFNSKSEEKKSENGKQGRSLDNITKGALLHIEGITEGTKREDIKELFNPISTVGWVDFDMGDKEVYYIQSMFPRSQSMQNEM